METARDRICEGAAEHLGVRNIMRQLVQKSRKQCKNPLYHVKLPQAQVKGAGSKKQSCKSKAERREHGQRPPPKGLDSVPSESLTNYELVLLPRIRVKRSVSKKHLPALIWHPSRLLYTVYSQLEQATLPANTAVGPGFECRRKRRSCKWFSQPGRRSSTALYVGKSRPTSDGLTEVKGRK
eukprot:1150415-Pelagomonas_calceolata.AAC.2